MDFSLFRERAEDAHHRVTYIELFFDLVFVFAVTQLSHHLLEDFTALGVVETSLLLLAVWWVWVYTTWITNWLDPDRTPVRLMLLALMLLGLGMSTAISQAFETRGLVFALMYVGMQIGRTLFMRRAIPSSDVALRQNFTRILVWLTVAAVFWIAGGLGHHLVRLGLWSVALAIEYIGPAARFSTPGLGASRVSDWAIEGGHFAERCALFIIIALGESLLVTGATFAKSDWTGTAIGTFASTFSGTVAMWWIYFDKGVEAGVERITHAPEPGRLARLAYTYLHLPVVAGIMFYAIADELVAGHGEFTTAAAVASIVGGPLVYLIGVLLFKRSTRGRFDAAHVAGIVALASVAPVASLVSRLTLVITTAVVLVIVAVWESLAGRATTQV